MRKIWIVLFSLALLGILIVFGFVVAVYQGAYGHVQTREELLTYKNATASIVLSEKGELLGKFFTENRTTVTRKEIPFHLTNALIATEDIRFYKHRGFDTKSFFRVLIKTVLLNNRSAGGGSTITQQLAKNMYGRDNYGRLTILVNKVKEIILARRLERSFSKEDIFFFTSIQFHLAKTFMVSRLQPGGFSTRRCESFKLKKELY
jgi:penicillin-binding protein 1A